MAWDWESYGNYVGADERRQRAATDARKLAEKGRKLSPVRPAGRAIAASFWGKAWCQNLEGYSDYASRLPRGRSYLRQGAVVDLQVTRGTVKALVSGTQLYEVEIKIDTLAATAWTRLKKEGAGKVGSLMDLLQGRLAGAVMEIVTRRDTGLFPKPAEIHLECSCPDYADLCKHVAATLYGVGARLDEHPELLFALRGVDHLELIDSAAQSVAGELAASTTGSGNAFDESRLSEIFGIDIEENAAVSKRSKHTGKAARITAKVSMPKPRARQQSVAGSAGKKAVGKPTAVKQVLARKAVAKQVTPPKTVRSVKAAPKKSATRCEGKK